MGHGSTRIEQLCEPFCAPRVVRIADSAYGLQIDYNLERKVDDENTIPAGKTHNPVHLSVSHVDIRERRIKSFLPLRLLRRDQTTAKNGKGKKEYIKFFNTVFSNDKLQSTICSFCKCLIKQLVTSKPK